MFRRLSRSLVAGLAFLVLGTNLLSADVNRPRPHAPQLADTNPPPSSFIVKNEDGSSAIDLPFGWKCVGGKNGLLIVKGPNGHGVFGGVGRISMKGAPAGKIPSPHAIMKAGFARLVQLAEPDAKVTNVRIDEGRSERSESGTLGGSGTIQCEVNGQPMLYAYFTAAWKDEDGTLKYSSELIGVDGDDAKDAATWMVQAIKSFRVTEEGK